MTREESNLLFKHLNRKKYIEAMEETQFGWKSAENFPNVCCPSDLEFISVEEEQYKGECHTTCEQCWKYVLENKNW